MSWRTRPSAARHFGEVPATYVARSGQDEAKVARMDAAKHG